MKLELKNIILRQYQSEDWERVHLYASSSDFTQFEAWGPNTIEDTKVFIKEMIVSQSATPRYKYEFAIIERESGLLIGGCSLRRDTEHSQVGNFGYAVNPDFQGRGVATEATKALLKFAFEEIKLSVVYATCDADNIASYSVMKKCNMKQVGCIKGRRVFKDKVADELRFEITDTIYEA